MSQSGRAEANQSVLECGLGMLGRSQGLLGLSLGRLGFNLDVLGRNLGILGPIQSELPPGLHKHAPKLLVRFDVLCLFRPVYCTRGATRSLVQRDVLGIVAGEQQECASFDIFI